MGAVHVSAFLASLLTACVCVAASSKALARSPDHALPDRGIRGLAASQQPAGRRSAAHSGREQRPTHALGPWLGARLVPCRICSLAAKVSCVGASRVGQWRMWVGAKLINVCAGVGWPSCMVACGAGVAAGAGESPASETHVLRLDNVDCGLAGLIIPFFLVTPPPRTPKAAPTCPEKEEDDTHTHTSTPHHDATSTTAVLRGGAWRPWLCRCAFLACQACLRGRPCVVPSDIEGRPGGWRRRQVKNTSEARVRSRERTSSLHGSTANVP